MEENYLLNNRYRILSNIGGGNFTKTYVALDLETDKKCVVKQLFFKRLKYHKSLELFEREAKVLEDLGHPQIPNFIDYFTVETDNDLQIYLIQEYIEAKSLIEFIQEGRHFTEKEVIEIGLKIVNILEYLHSFSPPIIHRDIKPSNVLLNNDNIPYLIDFGAVKDEIKKREVEYGVASTIVGTPGYMPMEQLEGRAMPASDIYSLGITLIFILSRQNPIDMGRDGMKIDFRAYVNISNDFVRVLEKMIHPYWKKRYLSVLALKNDLLLLSEGKEISKLSNNIIKKSLKKKSMITLKKEGIYTFTPEEIEEGKVLAGISYFGLLGFLIAFIRGKDKPYVLYHAQQALVVLAGFTLAAIPFIGVIISLLSVILMVIGMINGFSGRVKPLPIVGKFGAKIGLLKYDTEKETKYLKPSNDNIDDD